MARGSDPTPSQLAVASDALAAAREGLGYASMWQKLFRPSLETVEQDYKDLSQLWDDQGWSTDSIVAFAHLMDHAAEVAGPDVWVQYDLGVRRLSVANDLKGTPAYEAPSAIGTAVSNITDTVRTFAVNAGRSVGMSLDFLRTWGVWLVAIAGAFLFLYLIRPWIMAFNARSKG